MQQQQTTALKNSFTKKLDFFFLLALLRFTRILFKDSLPEGTDEEKKNVKDATMNSNGLKEKDEKSRRSKNWQLSAIVFEHGCTGQ